MKPVKQSEYKERLLDAASEIISADGLEGLTAGKLASHVGQRRTIVHLLAALVRRSVAAMSRNILEHMSPLTIGDDLWTLYRNALYITEAVRARALSSEVVGEAYRDAMDASIAAVSTLLQEGYRLRGLTPEIPLPTMAMVIMMAAQFAGVERALGRTDEIDALEAYMKSLFGISAGY